MEYRQLSKNPSVEASTLAIGCWNVSDPKAWGSQDETEALTMFEASLDAGINFFDTASLYGDGHSEELLGKALKKRRDEAIFATKVARWHLEPSELKASCEASLRRLQTDYIDLYQVHWPSREVAMEAYLGALLELQKEGKVRAISVCNFGKEDLSEWLSLGGPHTTNQLGYSLLSRGIENEIAPIMDRAGMKVLCYSPLMQGLLTGRYRDPDSFPEERARSRHFKASRPFCIHGEDGLEDLTFRTLDRLIEIAEGWGVALPTLALAWLMHQPFVGTVIVGVRSRQQLERNLKALDLKLSSEQVAALNEATKELHLAMGPEADLWQNPSRMR